MINLDVNLGTLLSGTAPGSSKSQSSPLSTQSFTALLSEALSETLSKFGIDPNTIKLTVQNQSSQSSATSQSAATTNGAPGTVSPPPPPDTNAPVAPHNSSAQHWYASNPADDAYWSHQPAAVQQLREMDDPDQRKQLGEQLAKSGFAIDVPIMIWGWDAGKVMQARQSYGYTWVPSALQQQVSAAPGISVAGVTPYDSKYPPAGSILPTAV